MLIDNKIEDNYYYEIIVFTGNRKEAATDSIVRFIMSGDNGDTDIRIFNHPDRQIFRRSGIDSFIMTVSEPLGSLNFMKIWHDSKHPIYIYNQKFFNIK
jgi:polycystin 1L2